MIAPTVYCWVVSGIQTWSIWVSQAVGAWSSIGFPHHGVVPVWLQGHSCPLWLQSPTDID
jgi:hypothetical protein